MEMSFQRSKRCPYCKNEFVPKRLNQIYCSPNHKASFNNDLARQQRLASKPVTDIINRNIRNIDILYKKKTFIWTTKELAALGIDLRFHNQILSTEPYTLRIGPYKITINRESTCKIEKYE